VVKDAQFSITVAAPGNFMLGEIGRLNDVVVILVSTT
jgi:hypothetical protein